MYENLVMDSLQTSRFQILSDQYKCPCDAINTFQSANIIIAFEFFGMLVSTRTPSVFLGRGKVVLAFEKIYLSFDIQVIFYGQMTSIIYSILF